MLVLQMLFLKPFPVTSFQKISESLFAICRHISSEVYGTFVVFSVKLTLCMQIIGFFVRLSSSLLWIQMYRLGVSHLDASALREADADLRNSFLSPPTPSIVRHPSGSDDVLGGSIYNPAYYSSLFEDGKDDAYMHSVSNIYSPSALFSFLSVFSGIGV